MARPKADPMVVRLRCPEHPDNRVWLDGFEPCRWSDAHRRPRLRFRFVLCNVMTSNGHNVARNEPDGQQPRRAPRR